MDKTWRPINRSQSAQSAKSRYNFYNNLRQPEKIDGQRNASRMNFISLCNFYENNFCGNLRLELENIFNENGKLAPSKCFLNSQGNIDPPHTIPFLERYTWTNSRPPRLSSPQARKKRSNRNQIKTNRNFDNFSISIWLQFPHFIWANSQPKFALGSFSSFVWLNHMLMQTTWTFSFAWVYFLIFCYTRDEAIIRNDLCIGTRWFARLLNPQCCRWLKIFCLIFLGNTAV